MDAKLIYDGYERKSTEDSNHQVASIESQDRELKEFQDKFNLSVRKFVSESKSAHKTGRPVFNQLLQDLEEGKINAILTWHANRLARNAYDAGRLIYLMDEGKLIEIRTPHRVFRNTPEDKFMLTLEFGISKKDSDDKIIVIRRGIKNKLINGWRPGVAPHGYLNDKAGDEGNRKIFTDPERFDFIKKIFQLKYEGISVREIFRIANEEWAFKTRPKRKYPPKPLAMSTLYAILTNPFYCGRFQYGGEWFEGKHEKAVEPEVFDQIQIMLGSKGCHRKPKTHEFAYTGMMRCGECKGTVTAEEKYQVICSDCKLKFSLTRKNNNQCPGCNTLIEDMTKPTLLHYVYYHCTKRVNPKCTQRAVEVGAFEYQVKEILDGIEISDCFMDWAIREINKESVGEKQFREGKIESLQRAHKECRQKLDNLLQLKISSLNTDGSLISDEKFKAEKETLEVELKALEKQLAEIDTRMIQAAQEMSDMFDFACKAREKFNTDDLSVKRDMLYKLGSNLILENKLLRLDAPEYFISLKAMKDKAPIIGKPFEPNEKGYTKAQLEHLYSTNPAVSMG